jgi:hypothetical protein
MILGSRVLRPNHLRGKIGGSVFLLLLAVCALTSKGSPVPSRLILALDGIAYRDMQALQEGVVCTNFWGRRIVRRAFTTNEGYFPVSRMVSTFPSISDVAWTDIFGDRPLIGYQRTYFSAAANAQIVENGVTTTVEHERQMQWQVGNGLMRTLGFIFPVQTFNYELHGLVKNFWKCAGTGTNYYAFMRTSDDAQHLDSDILWLLCKLDNRLERLRARYRAKEGHDLEIVILSDHGHNHAGRGKRVEVRDFLQRAGYRISKSIADRKDVVIPTAGIETWVEIHNAPAETEALLRRLTQLQGVDLLTAAVAGRSNCFVVMNAKCERAMIEWNPAKNAYRYRTEQGDPLHYGAVVETLGREKLLDADGFATSDAWMEATMSEHYPLALERIVGGHTRITLNPATILISLDNHYVNSGRLVDLGSRFVTLGSTHGALDDINSDGIVLCNFVATRDTSSSRVSGQFDDFPGLRQYRAEQNGGEWISEKEQALTRIARTSLDRGRQVLTQHDVFLRIWSPQLSRVDGRTPVEVEIKKTPVFPGSQIQRGNFKPAQAPGLRLTFDVPVSFPDKCDYERIYECPSDLVLEPLAEYRIWGWLRGAGRSIPLFEFTFHANRSGRPAAF